MKPRQDYGKGKGEITARVKGKNSKVAARVRARLRRGLKEKNRKTELQIYPKITLRVNENVARIKPKCANEVNNLKSER